MHRKIVGIVGCLLVAACGSSSEEQESAKSPVDALAATGKQAGGVDSFGAGIRRTLLVREDIPNRGGYESRVYLIEAPSGVQAAPHAYTEQCVGYVVEGAWEPIASNTANTIERAGDGFILLPHQPLSFRSADSSHPLRYVLSGMFAKGEALSEAVDSAAKPALAVGSADGVVAMAAVKAHAPAALTALTEVRRTLLAERPIDGAPGLESRIYLVEFPPGAEGKLHVHSSQGVGYVLEGSFESSFADGPTTTKREGEGFMDLPGKPHHFRNPDSTRVLRFLVAGTYHKDEPMLQVIAP